MIPTWLQAHLDSLGLWNTDGISRRARGRHCRTCRAPILTGLDDDRCGLPVTADPAPIDEVGELIALAAGRRTFDLRQRPTLRLNHRPTWRIGKPRQHDVLAEHRCGEPHLPTTSSRLTPPPPGWTDTPEF